MNRPYPGEVPFPLPDGAEGCEYRENKPFRICMTVMRRANPAHGGLMADSKHRCFRIFNHEFKFLEKYLGFRLEMGMKIWGDWVLLRKSVAYGLMPVRLRVVDGGEYEPVLDMLQGSYPEVRNQFSDPATARRVRS